MVEFSVENSLKLQVRKHKKERKEAILAQKKKEEEGEPGTEGESKNILNPRLNTALISFILTLTENPDEPKPKKVRLGPDGLPKQGRGARQREARRLAQAAKEGKAVPQQAKQSQEVGGLIKSGLGLDEDSFDSNSFSRKDH